MKPETLSAAGEVQLIDVRLPDDFESEHIAGARNNCVFEVAFTDRLPVSAPDPARCTIVYGANAESSEAAAAAEKLHRAGYKDVRILEGGLQAAKEAGLKTVQGNPLPVPRQIPDGVHEIDLRESRLEWLGRNLLNKHWGTVALESGFLVFENGNPVGGEFVIDLTRMECTDLAGTELHDVLISHLHNDDFFDVENHPKARFVITKVSPSNDSAPGSCNLDLSGDLTLRGQTHSVEFTAASGITEDGKAAAQASFSIDRTRWGILYGSGRFFHRLAGHVVNDMLEFQLRIVTK